MTARPLAALDAAFLELERPSAHMHVGFAAALRRPDDGRTVDFAVLRDHIAGRLGRSPRYRQRLAATPLGLADPVWVDDPDFEVDRHILRAPGGDLAEVAAQVMSVPLERDRPLWEMWIADELDDGGIGLVGKLHHCMVDGLGAVELAGALLDVDADTPPADPPDGWRADPTPRALQAIAVTAAQGARDALALTTLPARLARDPERLLALPGATVEAARTLVAAVLPAAPPSLLNGASSPLRHLAVVRRPLDELRAVKRAHGTTLNDVVLAAVADALGRFVRERGEAPEALRAMVPVNVRDGGAEELGNRISFLFLDLPTEPTDPAERLAAVRSTTVESKERGEAGHVQAALGLLGQVPRGLRRLAGQVLGSPRTANLVVSNIPGPPVPVWLAGCPVEAAFPIVPLTERHGVSVGMLSVAGEACFGLYADRKALPDIEALAGHLDAALDDLLATT